MFVIRTFLVLIIIKSPYSEFVCMVVFYLYTFVLKRNFLFIVPSSTGWVLSSFFYGYIFTQIPGGYLAGRYGGRYIFGVGVLMTAILTLLTPLAAEIHIGALIALRVIEGFFEVGF